MKFLDRLRRFKRLDELIRRKGTGTPAQLAERLNVSKPTVVRYIRLLRDLGAQLEYDAWRKTYHYTDDFKLDLNKIV